MGSRAQIQTRHPLKGFSPLLWYVAEPHRLPPRSDGCFCPTFPNQHGRGVWENTMNLSCALTSLGRGAERPMPEPREWRGPTGGLPAPGQGEGLSRAVPCRSIAAPGASPPAAPE